MSGIFSVITVRFCNISSAKHMGDDALSLMHVSRSRNAFSVAQARVISGALLGDYASTAR